MNRTIREKYVSGEDNARPWDSGPDSCHCLWMGFSIGIRLECGLLAFVAGIFAVGSNHGKQDGGPAHAVVFLCVIYDL